MIPTQSIETPEMKPFIVGLPSGSYVQSNLSGDKSLPGIYGDMPKMAVSFASTPNGAVGNVVFRTLKDKIIARTILSRLKDSVGLENCAFEAPTVSVGDNSQRANDDYWAHAADLLVEIEQRRPDIPEDERQDYMLRLLKFYQNDRRKRA
jgi:hypothetical protein